MDQAKLSRAQAEADELLLEIEAAMKRSRERGSQPSQPPPTPRGAAAAEEDTRSDDEQERARVEWLKYFMASKDWEGAATMVITNEETRTLEEAKARG
jgi:hypothetical protein